MTDVELGLVKLKSAKEADNRRVGYHFARS